MGKHNLPEEAEIRKKFRDLRERLKKQIESYDESEFELKETTDAIKYQYGILARLEEELEKVPRDEDLELELEEFTETEYEGKKAYTRIPEKTYNKLLRRLERLEAKLNRVTILNDLGRNARLLTQNITAQATIEESRANTKRIEIETHHASLLQLTKIFYLALRKRGFTDDEIASVAKELKRIQKDYPLIQTDFDQMKQLLFAQPEEIPNVIDADYEEVDDKLAEVNATLNKKAKRGRKK
jgi:hypothetical protein